MAAALISRIQLMLASITRVLARQAAGLDVITFHTAAASVCSRRCETTASMNEFVRCSKVLSMEAWHYAVVALRRSRRHASFHHVAVFVLFLEAVSLITRICVSTIQRGFHAANTSTRIGETSR